MNCNSHKSGNFWLGFFLGGLVGAFIIFVLGTKEGKKIAEKLLDQAEDYEEGLEEKDEKLQKHGEELLQQAEKVKEKVTKEVEKGEKKVSQALVSKMDQTLTTIEDLGKRGVAITQDLHHRYFKKNGKTLTS